MWRVDSLPFPPQPCVCMDYISEWKQWVLLRHEPYHWQRAWLSHGFLASTNSLLLECSAFGETGPLDSVRISDEAVHYEAERSTSSVNRPKRDDQATETIQALLLESSPAMAQTRGSTEIAANLTRREGSVGESLVPGQPLAVLAECEFGVVSFQ